MLQACKQYFYIYIIDIFTIYSVSVILSALFGVAPEASVEVAVSIVYMEVFGIKTVLEIRELPA